MLRFSSEARTAPVSPAPPPPAVGARTAPAHGRAVPTVGGHGVCRVPGVVPGLKLHEAPDSYGRPFGFISTTGGGLHTVLIEYTGPASPRDGELIGTWVARWRQVVDALKDSPLRGICVTVEQLRPHVLRFALTYGDSEAPTAPTAAEKRRSKRAGVPEMAVRIGSRLPRLCSLLEAVAGGQAAPLSAASVTYGLRATFDPSVAELVGRTGLADGAGTTVARPPLRWRDAPPRTVREGWDHVVHDNAVSATWAMAGLPEDEPFRAMLTPAPGLANVRLQVHFRRAMPMRGQHDEPGFAVTGTSTAPVTEATAALDTLPNALSGHTRWHLRRAYSGQAAGFAAGACLGIAIPGQLRAPQTLGRRR